MTEFLQHGPGAFANVFIPDYAPAYAAMIAWSEGKDVDPREWKMSGTDPADAKYEKGRPGIWVTLTAFSARGGRPMPKTIGSELLADIARREREASGTAKPEEIAL